MVSARTEVAAWELRVEGGPEVIGRLRDELRERGWHPHVQAGTALSCCFSAGGGGRDEAGAWGQVARSRGLTGVQYIEHKQKVEPEVGFESSVQVEARRLAGLGHRVVELWGVRADGRCGCGRTHDARRAGKHPRPATAGRGDDPVGIAAGSNIGVAQVGMLTFDLDGADSEAALARQVEVHGPLPDGYAETRTGRVEGGRHLTFGLPPGMEAASVPGVEVLAGPGHYVVTAPSLHASGVPYTEVRQLERSEDLPWAPGWAVAPVQARPQPATHPATPPAIPSQAQTQGQTPTLERAVLDLSDTGRGGRHNTLVRWSYTLGGVWAAGRGPGLGEAEAALMSAAWRCGLLADDGRRQCHATFAGAWKAGAQRPLRATGAPRDPANVEVLTEIRSTMAGRVWAGASGAVDLRVLDALVALGEGLARVEVRHSQRQVASACSLQRRAVGRAIHRLEKAGWLAIIEVGVGRLGSTYLLSCPASDQGEDIYDPVVLSERRQDPEPAVPRAHDVWIGLPASAPIVLGVLSRGPVRTPALAAVLGVSDRQAQRVLHSLAQVGLTVPDQGRWRLSDPAESDMVTALDAAAETLGTVGAMDRMRARHQEERVRYRAWWDGREECRRRRHRSAPRYRPCREPVPQSAPTSLIGSRGPP